MWWRRLFICHMCVVSTVSGVLSTILHGLRIQPIFPVSFFQILKTESALVPLFACGQKLHSEKKLINLGLGFFCSDFYFVRRHKIYAPRLRCE